MRKRYVLAAAMPIFLSLCLPLSALAEAPQAKAGFVDASIWFSSEPDTVGETVTVSTLINNQDGKAIYGTVTFQDNGKVFGEKAATIEPHASKVVSASWKVTAGDHAMSAKFVDTKQGSDKGPATEVENGESKTLRFSVMEEADKRETPKGASGVSVASAQAGAKDPAISSSDVEKTVDEAKNAAETAFEKFDDFRESTGEVLGEKAEAATEEVEAAKAAKNDGEEQSFLKTPFAYLKMLFFKAAHFIFSEMYAFYGLIALIVILFIRYLIRAPR